MPDVLKKINISVCLFIKKPFTMYVQKRLIISPASKTEQEKRNQRGKFVELSCFAGKNLSEKTRIFIGSEKSQLGKFNDF